MNEKYIIFEHCGTVCGTVKSNYDSRVMNARMIQRFEGSTKSEAKEYCINYFLLDEEDIIII